jgi:hypothetical protein
MVIVGFIVINQFVVWFLRVDYLYQVILPILLSRRHSELFSQLDVKDPLIQLANTINWTVFDDAFEQHYSQDNGRPSKPIRLMVGYHDSSIWQWF